MKSVKIYLRRIEGKIIPYEYNYYLSIALYSKLSLYQENVTPLHNKKQQGLHTFSNIISKDAKNAINGLDIDRGFIIFRAIDSKLIEYLKLGLSEDPVLRIGEAIYHVNRVEEDPDLEIKDRNILFKSISPVLIRDFFDKKKFVDNVTKIEENLSLVSKWTLRNYYNLKDEQTGELNFKINSARSKTIKISNNKKKESITKAFYIEGQISGTPESIAILYYKGLGSKTSLGLGCWRVSNE